MKRVLLVKGADICYGGVSVLLYQLMKAMDRSELQVDLYTYGGIDAKDLYDQYCDIGVNIILGGHPDYNPKEIAADLNRLLRETRYDAVHSNTGRLQMMHQPPQLCLRTAADIFPIPGGNKPDFLH